VPAVAQIARENGVNDNVIFKWLRLWQDEGRISRRLPAIVNASPLTTMLPVEVIPGPAPLGEMNPDPGQFAALNASSCCVEFRHGKITLDNPSSELLAVLFHELTGRSR
jgi:transposase